MTSYLYQGICFAFFVATWIITFFCIQSIFYKNESITKMIGYTAIIWTFFVVLITEGLSLFDGITRKNLFIAWGLILFIEIAFLLFRIIKVKTDIFCNFRKLKNITAETEIKPIDYLLLFITVFLLLRSTFIALFSAPFSWDSMTYHLPRIMYWIEHKNVNYYFTNIERQLFSPVLAEYINLHVISLTGGDFFVKMLQNLSAYGCAFLVTGISFKMTKSLRYGLLGSIIMVTANVFFGQSVSTQVDLTAAFFLLVILNMLLDLVYSEKLSVSKENVVSFVILGLGCGILFGVKSSAAVPAAFLILGTFIYRIIRKDRIISLCILALISAVNALVVSAPQFIRNYSKYGDILASKEMGRICISTFNPLYIFVNISKNIGTMLASWWNCEFIKKTVGKIAYILHIDINAPQITFEEESNYRVIYALDVDNSSTSLLVSVICIVFIYGIYRVVKYHKGKDILNFIMLLQFFVMCAVLRWQPWCSRLILPSMIVCVIPLAYFFCMLSMQAKGKIKGKIPALLAALVIVEALSANAEGFAYYRNILGIQPSERMNANYLLLNSYSNDKQYYNQAFEIIETAMPESLGFYCGFNSYQYPFLWCFAGKMQIENVVLTESDEEVPNYENVKNFVPQYIFAAQVYMDDSEEYWWNGAKYHCVYSNGDNYFVWELDTIRDRC